ncbi:MAG: hypothetical protein ACE14M_05900 [Terriglobales bacterium]
MKPKKNSEFHISWMTISYRSVAMLAATILVILILGVFLLFPQSAPVVAIGEIANKLLDKAGLGSVGTRTGTPGPQQAHFTNLDGTVRVKKANSNTWINADYSLPLDKGDVIQTTSEGMAKVVFPDGTNYTVKQDSLIVIEENSTTSEQKTNVAVQVTTGTVDLATATYAQGSTSQVIVAGATASLAPESSAMVRNDPRKDEHEILVKKGSGRVTRKNETVTLANYEKVSFKAETGQMAKQKEIGPPTLIAPAHMSPLFTSGTGRSVDFSWTPAVNSRGYRLRVSRNPYFSSTVFDKVVQTTEARVPSLKEGTYYWVVSSMDVTGRESVESERNQFTLVARAADSVAIPLELQPFIQHGHVIEVKGKTDPNARVMVNGHEVPVILADGSFHYFTPPLPLGENVITVTAQNAKGGVKTQQKKVVIE